MCSRDVFLGMPAVFTGIKPTYRSNKKRRVCAHLELSPTLWGAEIFPYIALILGLENTLCITRAVVNTPPTLDVSSRIAHGLAQEGYSLCKYFVMELSFLAIGYATRIAEIQEFCMFASIGLVIDFYMQMFFYAPCLTFDLQRLSAEEKAKFALRLFNTDIPRLSDFVPVRCPMRKLWPSFFELKRRKKRTLSESQLDERDIQEDTDKKGFRCRSNSVSNTDWTYDGARPYRNPLSSNRLRILYFVTRTRIFQ
ncbi:SSD domain-containing protein, partial [Trichostrongylus colubriformis]